MFKSVNEGKLPTKGSKFSACVDVYANEDMVIGAGETKMIGLGIAIADIEKTSEKHARVQMLLNNEDYPVSLYEKMVKKSSDNFKLSHYLQLMLRSSLGLKGLILPNGVGVIDLDYKEEIKMIVHNPNASNGVCLLYDGCEINEDELPENHDEVKAYKIKKGDRIGQITLLEHKAYLFGIETEVERDGGFGSTGEK